MKGKVVLITGASSGIGRACALACGEKGARLVLAARTLENLQSVAAELAEKGVEVITVRADVSQEKDCQSFVEQAVSQFGQIDVLINNAGISMRALFEDVDLEVLRKVMDVNFWGTVYCTKYALPYLLQTKGSVTGIISIAGYIGLPARTGYSASKYAVRGFLETLRVENLKTGLHVLVAAPGFTASNIRNVALDASGAKQGESPRDESNMMSAEECAGHIIKAIEKRKRELVLTFVEGKFTVWLKKWFPRLLERLTYNHMAKEPNSPLRK